MFNFGGLLIGPAIIILNGAVVFWLANRIMRDEAKARLSSFSLMIGIVLGRFGAADSLADDAGLIIGQMFGLGALWFLFFKERVPHPASDVE